MKKFGLLLLVCLVNASFGVGNDSSTWAGKYECDTLPTDAGWTMPGWVAPGAYVYSAGTGVIAVSSLGTDQSPFWYRNDLTVDFSTGFTMEWRVKYIDGSSISSAPCSIGVSNEHTAFAMQGILIGKADVMGVGVAVNTQDDFHVYRMTVKNGYATLYMDNNVVPVTVQPVLAGDFGASMIRFGDVTGDEDAEYQIDYVRWTTEGAFVPPAPPATADSTTWGGRYECDTLPTIAGWTESNAGFCSASGGILTVDSLDTDYAPYWHRSDLNVDFSTGFTMEWKVKYVDGSSISSAPCGIGVSNNHTAFAMQGIKIGQADVMGVGVVVNTQDDFHVYRMTVKDGYATLYIDDNVNAATVQPLWAGDFGASMVRFGDTTGTEDAEYQIDYVRWTTAGAFAPPLPPATAESSTWAGRYECDTLPTGAGWTESNAGFCSISDGILTVDSLDTDYAPYWNRSDLTVDFSTGFTMEWRVKYIDGSSTSSAPCSIGVSNNHTAFAWQGVKIGKAEVLGVGVTVNTQDDFHVYRMTVKDGYATLYVDDNINAVTVQPVLAGDFGASMIRFGDVTGDEDAEYQIDYVRWTTAGAFAPPAPAHGDLNKDGNIDFKDLNVLATNWLSQLGPWPYRWDANETPGNFASFSALSIGGEQIITIDGGNKAYQVTTDNPGQVYWQSLTKNWNPRAVGNNTFEFRMRIISDEGFRDTENLNCYAFAALVCDANLVPGQWHTRGFFFNYDSIVEQSTNTCSNCANYVMFDCSQWQTYRVTYNGAGTAVLSYLNGSVWQNLLTSSVGRYWITSAGSSYFRLGNSEGWGGYGVYDVDYVYWQGPGCDPAVQGDVDGNCKVDFCDFAMLADDWLGQ